MQEDPFTGHPSRILGSHVLDPVEHAALQDNHERRLEALTCLSTAAARAGFGTDPDDDLVLFPSDELSLLAAAGGVWKDLHEAVGTFRSLLPLCPLDLFGFPPGSEDPFDEGNPRLRRIGSGVEATAFQSEDGSIYKFYLPREDGRIGGSFIFSPGSDEVAWLAEACLGSYRSLFEKLLLIMALQGMPTEVIAATPEGIIVAKQACGARVPDGTDTSLLQPPALIPIPSRFLRAHRDHPRLFFLGGTTWLIADLHCRNLVSAADGTLRAIDLLAAPLPGNLIHSNPLIAGWLSRVRHDPHAPLLREVDDSEL
ncbi:MAG: hypothetical protein KBA71_02515 [Opitutaceae bacterium]|nr:hypothetical protein [Opitutaceae bacterium]